MARKKEVAVGGPTALLDVKRELYLRLILINLSASPNLLCVLITLKLVICPCCIPSAGSSSIFASTYPTIFGGS